jgi:hypothetical protein
MVFTHARAINRSEGAQPFSDGVTRNDPRNNRASARLPPARCGYCDTRRELFLDGEREIEGGPRARLVRQ